MIVSIASLPPSAIRSGCSADYQIAVNAINQREYGKGLVLLRAITEDGKARPVQVQAGNLLKQIEQQASAELANAKQMLDRGNGPEASALLTKLVKDYAGTPVAPEAAGLLTSLSKTPELQGVPRGARARELLAQAKNDFRTEQWLFCLERCDLLGSSYSDLPESVEAREMANAIRGNPELMHKTCESLTGRLGEMYLSLADTWLQKGQPQQAMLCLDRVIRTLPGTRQAETAQLRMAQLQGLPAHQAGSPKR